MMFGAVSVCFLLVTVQFSRFRLVRPVISHLSTTRDRPDYSSAIMQCVQGCFVTMRTCVTDCIDPAAPIPDTGKHQDITMGHSRGGGGRLLTPIDQLKAETC